MRFCLLIKALFSTYLKLTMTIHNNDRKSNQTFLPLLWRSSFDNAYAVAIPACPPVASYRNRTARMWSTRRRSWLSHKVFVFFGSLRCVFVSAK